MEYIYENTVFNKLVVKEKTGYRLSKRRLGLLLLVLLFISLSITITFQQVNFFIDRYNYYMNLERDFSVLSNELMKVHSRNTQLNINLAARKEEIKTLRKTLDYKTTSVIEMIPTSTYTFTATAYTAGPESTGKSPGDPAYGVTKSGEKVKKWHTIAADPNVLPIGTRVFIPEFADQPNNGIFVVEDTGRRDGTKAADGNYKHIQGKRIDIYHPDLAWAKKFGRRDLNIIVLDELAAKLESAEYVKSKSL
jgi:3D (Asp-Asp-Asp) domain-containing protein